MQLWKPGLSHKEYCTQRQRFQNNPVFLIQKKIGQRRIAHLDLSVRYRTAAAYLSALVQAH